MPNFPNVYIHTPKNIIYKQLCKNLCTQNYVFNTERKYTDVVLWVQLHTLAYERGCILHSVPSDKTPIDVESLSKLDRASERICHIFHNQDRKLHFICKVSRRYYALKIHCELVGKSRAKYATVPGQSVYERSTRLTFAVFRLSRDGSNIVAVRLSVISHFARRSVHSKAITLYSVVRVCAQRRRKCYKYTKMFDTYTSCRLITQ